MKQYLFFLLLISCIQCTTNSPNKRVPDNSEDKENHSDTEWMLFDSVSLKNGIFIEFWGEPSTQDLYEIKITNEGKVKRISYENVPSFYWMKTGVDWCNEDFLFLMESCGSPCWNCISISLNNDSKSKRFPFCMFTDPDLNLVVYPSQTNEDSLFIENLTTNEKISFLDDKPNPKLPLYLRIDSLTIHYGKMSIFEDDGVKTIDVSAIIQ